MEELHKLMKHSHVLIFKLSFIILVLMLFSNSCKRADNARNEINIMNSTSDTLVLNIAKRYISDEPMFYEIMPNHVYRLSVDSRISDFEIINSDFGDARDTIEIYRHDTLLVKWGGPLLSLPDTIHSFYNENSWLIEQGGRKNKYVIATFTITEDDFMRDD